MAITVSDAIDGLREDLRRALEKAQPDIVFTPGDIEIELGVTFEEETSVKGGIRAYIFSASAGSTDTQTHVHRLKFTLTASDQSGEPLKLSARAPVDG
jgi:Trypsin-co-occurring domain 2